MTLHTKDKITRLQYQLVDECQSKLLCELEDVLRELETRVPLPAKEEGNANYRYGQSSDQQACVMVLARLLSSIHAQRLLLSVGLVQDLEVCSTLFDELAQSLRTFVRKLVCERPNDHSISLCIDLGDSWVDTHHLMTIYTEPGPHFHVQGVVASPPWYQHYYATLNRFFTLIELFSIVAVSFSYSGMYHYVKGCGKDYCSTIDAMKIFNPAVYG